MSKCHIYYFLVKLVVLYYVACGLVILFIGQFGGNYQTYQLFGDYLKMQVFSRCPVTTRSHRSPQGFKPSLRIMRISRPPRVTNRPFHILGQLNRNVFCGAGAPADQRPGPPLHLLLL